MQTRLSVALAVVNPSAPHPSSLSGAHHNNPSAVPPRNLTFQAEEEPRAAAVVVADLEAVAEADRMVEVAGMAAAVIANTA
jgi:hypothetical protein